jgi:16S rRNA (cytosine967-C5)-methyltransferase
MKPSSLLGHTIEVFSEFRSNSAVPADAIIRRFFHERKYLGSKDRRYIADSYFGTIKNWRRLEAVVQDCFEDHEATPTRIVIAYASVFLGTTLEELTEIASEIRSSQEIPKEALPCLLDKEREEKRLQELPPDEGLSIRYSYPTWFVTRIRAEYGDDHVEKILNELNGEAPTVLRANTLMTDRQKLQEQLQKDACETLYSEMAAEALVLKKRVNVFGMESFRRGEFEVQDEGSQLVALFANIRKTSIKALDACAGAGGKTLHLAALMKNRGEIFASDVDDRKLEELRMRSRRSGAQNIRIVKQDQKDAMLGPDKEGWFDLLLLDVPCTGTGTLRRNPGIKWLLTEQMLQELLQKQRAILEENLHFVKVGGTIVYATCSILKEEGEEQVQWFVGQHPEIEVEETRRTRPDESGCDAFFIARMRKKSAPAVVPA